MASSLPLSVDYKPHLGSKTECGIGFIGTGEIVHAACFSTAENCSVRPSEVQ